MLFRVENDKGNKILAYVVPDAAGATPSVRIKNNGKELLTLEANLVRNNLVAAGRHETGRCAFIIDKTILPGISRYKELEIYEASTDLLIYRRAPAHAKAIRVFRLETHLLPLWRVDNAVKDNFQYWYRSIDRFGLETSTQVFCMKNASSLYISGRLMTRNFEHYIRKDMKAVAMIRDPFHELAERIIVLKNIGSRSEEILGLRDAMAFGPLVEALNEYSELDETFFKRFFKRTSFELLAMLSNPLTRLLTASSPDEMPVHTSVSTALQALSGFEVLGLRSDANYFSRALAESVGIKSDEIPIIAEYPRIIELGERLRQVRDAEAILEKDLEVFQLLSQAFKSVDPSF